MVFSKKEVITYMTIIGDECKYMPLKASKHFGPIDFVLYYHKTFESVSISFSMTIIKYPGNPIN